MLKNKDHAAAGPCKDHVLLPTTKTSVQGLLPAVWRTSPYGAGTLAARAFLLGAVPQAQTAFAPLQVSPTGQLGTRGGSTEPGLPPERQPLGCRLWRIETQS